jgi:putative DNA methylase
MAAQIVPRKKLIEVSIPLEAINEESAREKQIKTGKPLQVHLYWARRPLAACRAMLFAQLVDDPSACPEEFPTKAAQDAERDRLHKLIAALVPWEASNNQTILNAARYEIARSIARGRDEKLPSISQLKPQQIIQYLQENAPPVYDPFCGGGSIPLEAQRLGLKAMGSDLNPVAVLVSKAIIEFPPKFSGRRPVNPEANELHQWRGV